MFFERARKSAAELDEEFSRTGKLRGPLHGVPVSISYFFTKWHDWLLPISQISIKDQCELFLIQRKPLSFQ